MQHVTCFYQVIRCKQSRYRGFENRSCSTSTLYSVDLKQYEQRDQRNVAFTAANSTNLYAFVSGNLISLRVLYKYNRFLSLNSRLIHPADYMTAIAGSGAFNLLQHQVFNRKASYRSSLYSFIRESGMPLFRIYNSSRE